MYCFVIVIQMVVVLALAGVCIVDRTLFFDITNEDFVIEWLTAILFLAAGVVAGVAARRARRRAAPWYTTTALALAGLALLVVGFEEISWGQRIFDLKTPEGLSKVSVEGEINLHNIATGLVQQVAILGSFVMGVCLPALCLVHAPFRRLYESCLRLRAPNALIAVPCLLGYALCNPEWLLPTLVMGPTYACCGAFIALRLAPEREDRSRADAWVLGAGIAVALAVRIAQAMVGELSNGWMELGESCLALAAALLLVGTLAAPPPVATTPDSRAPGSPAGDNGPPRSG